MERIVGIGEYAISSHENDRIVTFALGSCVALTVYSPRNMTSGMVHIALPTSQQCRNLEHATPCYYATGAVPFLIDEMCSKYGCHRSELRIELFGGASAKRADDVFKVGPRNVLTVKAILARMNLSYNDKDTGGTCSRTVRLDVGTGKTRVISHQMII